MEKREIKSFTENEIYSKVKEASFDFMYKTRDFMSRTIRYYEWLNLIERFVEENMNVVVIGHIENRGINKHFRYQHSYWTEHNDVLTELDGARYVSLRDTEKKDFYVNVKSISWDIVNTASHGLMLKIYIVFKK